jgi:hypothetical protein
MALRLHDYSMIYHKVGGTDCIFEISDEDMAGDPSYFGYLAQSGSWIIQQRTASTGEYRYVSGHSDYATAWIGRAGLTYDYYYAL